MAWSKRELDAAITAYREALVAEGRTSGTIATYVGDVRRFVEWLAARDGADPPVQVPEESTRRHWKRPARTMLAAQIAVPPALHVLVHSWRDRGCPAQEAMPWPRDRWRLVHVDAEVLGRLPEALDRLSVRAVCADAASSPDAAGDALLATLCWGYGWVGYGPHRAAKMLGEPQAAEHLREVARIVRDEGAVEGYRALGGLHRIPGLGPHSAPSSSPSASRTAPIPPH